MIDWLLPRFSKPQVLVEGRPVPILLRRQARARRLTMRLAESGEGVCITMPEWCSTQQALTFAQARADWIAGQLARAAACAPAAPVAPGGHLPYRGLAHLVAYDEHAPRRPRHEPGRIVLGGPRAQIAARLQRWLEGEALALGQADLGDYCARAGVAVPQLFLSRARRRWGSCSPASPRQGRGPAIRLNWRLVMAPDPVRRSVVAHEVAHLTHFDHSPAFHRHLSSLFEGDLSAADRWLKQEGRGLYAPFG